MKYRSEIPPSSEKWIRGLFEELGVPYGFWLYWPKNKGMPRPYRLALCLAILRLKLAHQMSTKEIAPMFRRCRMTLAPYSQRGDWILSLNPVFERAFTKMEGEQAPAFLVHQWRDLWETLLDPSEDERVLA